MVGEGRRRDREMTTEIAASCFLTTSDCLQNFVASRVCQSLGDAMKLVGFQGGANVHGHYIMKLEDTKQRAHAAEEFEKFPRLG